MILIIAALVVGDHPRLFARHRQQVIQLDGVHTDETALREHLELLLGGRVLNVSVRSIDLVDDTTEVEVRYLAGPRVSPAEPTLRSTDLASTGALR